MSARHKRSRRRGTPSTLLSVLLISLLGVVAAVLSYVALTGVSDGEHGGHPVRPGQGSADASLPAEDTPTDSTSTEEAAFVSPKLLAISDDLAMRGEGGSCGMPGTVEFSFDGGEEWTDPVSLTEVGATQILRLLPLGPAQLEVAALDEDCEPHVYRTVDRGSTWTGPLPIEGTWYFDPANPRQVGAPEGPQPLPCEAVELSAADNRAVVTCRDGSLAISVDRGLNWETPETGDVLASAVSGDSFVVAQSGSGTCTGIHVVNIDRSGDAARIECHELGEEPVAIGAESVTVAQSGDTTLLWVGNDLTRLQGGGA